MSRLIVFLFLILFSSHALAEKRVALIIANSRYVHASHLANPANDARAVSDVLRSAGFAEGDITLKYDLGFDEMRRTLLSFGRQAAGADVALIYFAGHGYGSGVNYLIPVDAEMQSARDLPAEAISQRLMEDAVATARGLKLVILDACRNDPSQGRMALGGSARGISRGLEGVEPENGVLVAYSAKHGTVAQDGPDGGNSPFALALIKNLPTPGEDIRFVFGAIRDDVQAATGKEQEPFLYGSLGRNRIFLVPPSGPEQTPALSPAVPDALAHRLEALEEELRRQKTEAAERVRRAEQDAARLSLEAERRKAAELERQRQDQQKSNGGGARRNVCGWYAIYYCSKDRTVAEREARRMVAFVIDTDDRIYPNFARGWYCSAHGPMAKDDAQVSAARAKGAGFPTAYIKNPC